jgi:large subunit ribosomal protein L5
MATKTKTKTTAETKPQTKTDTARLKARYESEIRPSLLARFGYSSPMQAPVIKKITLNMGVGDGKQDSKVIDAATEQLATIAGQRPNVRRARKSIANFKLREGMPVGVSVTLRGERSYEFLDRLMSVAIPRIRDFRGLNPRAFDGRGNYSMGVREQIIFPEIDYDTVDQVRGLDITITTSATSDLEAFALLDAFGFPFAHEGRPTLPGDPEPEAAAPVPAAPAGTPAPKQAAKAEADAQEEIADAADAATDEIAEPQEDLVAQQSSETMSADPDETPDSTDATNTPAAQPDDEVGSSQSDEPTAEES